MYINTVEITLRLTIVDCGKSTELCGGACVVSKTQGTVIAKTRGAPLQTWLFFQFFSVRK